MSTTSPHGLLARAVRRVAGASARRPRTVVALWLVLVAACVAGGAMTGTNSLTGADAGAGESARADARLAEARLDDPAVETVLLQSRSATATRAAAADLERRAARLAGVRATDGPAQTPALSTAGGRTVLVQVTLRGDPDDAGDNVGDLSDTVAAVGDAHPQVTLHQAGPGTFDEAVGEVLGEDLRKAELVSLPLTLLILVLMFGALVAATVPLLLGITSVAAALGASGVVSQLVPAEESGTSLVVLIGLAVAVDYSLFYIRREREERAAGKGRLAALDAAAASVGRAIVISGVTVLIALAGLLIPGLAVFTSLGVSTMVVVAIAVLGSVTVLPAALSLLGDRIDKGRIPGLRRRRRSTRPGAWARLAASVTRRPAAALISAVCILGALAVPALDMQATDSGSNSLPRDVPVVAAERAIERSFPGAPEPAELVVTGSGLDERRGELAELGRHALDVTGGKGRVEVEVARDGRTAAVLVPMPELAAGAAAAEVAALRDAVRTAAPPDTQVLVTGAAAGAADFTDRLADTRPIVIGVVLALAFALLLGAFRSVRLAASVVALNLLSVAATYGVLTAVFQHEWAEGLLGFESNGTITDWLPLNAFVILFGLSMDYTILVLERIQEARRRGAGARDAAAEGVAATAGTVTSAALVMVAIFATFTMLPLLELKEMGVCLAAGILLDATVVRGIALPATVALLGDRGVRASRRRREGWDDRVLAPADAR